MMFVSRTTLTPHGFNRFVDEIFECFARQVGIRLPRLGEHLSQQLFFNRLIYETREIILCETIYGAVTTQVAFSFAGDFNSSFGVHNCSVDAVAKDIYAA